MANARAILKGAILVPCLALGAAWCLGRLLGERSLAASLLFYLPAPLAAPALLAAAALLRRRRRYCLGLTAVAILPLLTVIQEQNWIRPRAAEAPRPGRVLSLLHWNVSNGHGGWDRLAREISRGQPDLVVLSEVKRAPQLEAALAALKEFPYHQLGRPLLVLSRYPLEAAERIHYGQGVLIYRLALHQETETWSFFVLDVGADPNVARAPAIAALRAEILEREPDFVVGDFNTPHDSRLFHPLAPDWSHAYDLAGQGWSYTWPSYLPVLSLDHLFVHDPAVQVDRYEIGTSPWSDHRLQRASLRHRAAP